MTWAIRQHLTRQHLTRRLRVPPVLHTAAALIRRVHDDHTIPPQDRVVALLILLYAQPLIKIARLTVADVELDDGEVRLRLGGAPVPIIPPFSDVLLDHIATRSNRTTATNRASTLLFPGRRAGQPIHPGSPAAAPAPPQHPQPQRPHQSHPRPAPTSTTSGHRQHARLLPHLGRSHRRAGRRQLAALRSRRPHETLLVVAGQVSPPRSASAAARIAPPLERVRQCCGPGDHGV